LLAARSRLHVVQMYEQSNNGAGIVCKVKDKAVLLCLPKHHAVQMYTEVEEKS
jgi:hypothetical protein